MSKDENRRNTNGQFVKGQSGNPAGRPKADPDRKPELAYGELFNKVALSKVTRTNAAGREESITRYEALLEKLWAKGVKGDVKAAQQFFELAGSQATERLLERPDMQELLTEDEAIITSRFKEKVNPEGPADE
jgi:hypothetical protein